MKALLDQPSPQQVADVANTAAKATTVTMTGQLLFGYTVNEWAAIVGIAVTLIQFTYWIYEKFIKEE